ncbi:MAG: response regulator [Bacteroidetes bacterium]|nr:response regulator [Bacteroidota bacterium]
MTSQELIIIEDDVNDFELTSRIIQRGGYDCSLKWLKDGTEALAHFPVLHTALAGETKPAKRLILLDIKLPKIDGLQVLKELKADEVLRKIPVVLFSSSNQERDIVQAYHQHVNSYVVKPIDFDEYSALIHTMLTY